MKFYAMAIYTDINLSQYNFLAYDGTYHNPPIGKVKT